MPQITRGVLSGQKMLIFNKEIQTIQSRTLTKQNKYRAPAEYNKKLCVMDCEGSMLYKDFIDAMIVTGVTYAIYLDMGSGWNYSFYRDSDNSAQFIYSHQIPYTTNWIAFYK